MLITCKNSDKSSPSINNNDASQRDTLSKSVEVKIDAKAVNDYKERLHDIIETMNNSLGQIELTGNPESDFARLMTTDLLAGVEICLLHQKNAIDSSMKQLAKQKQLYLQRQEDYFDDYQFQSNSSYSPTSKRKAPALKHLNIPDGATQDVVFATIVSEYNQNIIDLANAYLKKGSNTEMRKAAQDLIRNFSLETNQLRKFSKG